MNNDFVECGNLWNCVVWNVAGCVEMEAPFVSDSILPGTRFKNVQI